VRQTKQFSAPGPFVGKTGSTTLPVASISRYVRTSLTSRTSWRDCIYSSHLSRVFAVGGGSYAGPGLGRHIARSVDGTAWDYTLFNPDLLGICIGRNNRLVAVGATGAKGSAYSDDGDNWTPFTVGNSSVSIAYSPTLDLYIAVADAGSNRVMSSTDLITWTPVAVASRVWRRVRWIPELNRFFIVANDSTANAIAESSDGINFTLLTTPGSFPLTDIVYIAGSLVACSPVATDLSILRSTDSGVTWDTVGTGSGSTWFSMATNSALIVAIAATVPGTLYFWFQFSSDNGETWTSVILPGGQALYGVCSIPKVGFLAVCTGVSTQYAGRGFLLTP